MLSRARHALLCALLLPAAASAAVQEPEHPDAPPVETLVARALSQAPSVAAQRARAESIRLALPAADALPDPMVEFEYRAGGFPRYTIGSDPGSMAGASVRQDLLSRGRRAARRDRAAAEAAREDAAVLLLTSTLATGIRVRYAEVYALDREADTLAAAGEVLRLLEATAAARYAAGESDQASVLRAQLERTRLGERVADLSAARRRLVTELNGLMNEAPHAPLGVVRVLPAAPEPPAASDDEIAALAGGRAAEVQLREREVAAGDRRVVEARSDLERAWSVGGGLYWQGGLDRMAVVNVGIELPFRKARRQLPLVAAAERARDAARFEAAGARVVAQADTAGLLVDARTAADQIERYREGILPQSSAALDATRSSYLAGRGDFVAVLDEFRRWIDVRVGVAQRERDRYVALVRLDALLNPAPAGDRDSTRSSMAGEPKDRP